MATFVAVDFETANHSRDGACALGLALCKDGRLVDARRFLIRPPARGFVFTDIHGLTWDDVRQEPTLGDLWPVLEQYLEKAGFFTAHNAPFDRGVPEACCRACRIMAPTTPFQCTVRLARAQWGIYPASRMPGNSPGVMEARGV